MRVKPFSITVDGSSDNGLEKMNPLTVRVISDSGVIYNELLDICMSSNSTAEGIFSKMQDAFLKHEVS